MHETFDPKEYEDCYLLLSEACFFMKMGLFKQTQRLTVVLQVGMVRM